MKSEVNTDDNRASWDPNEWNLNDLMQLYNCGLCEYLVMDEDQQSQWSKRRLVNSKQG